MALERGTIHARIWAPPKFFYVNTEAASASISAAPTRFRWTTEDGLLRVTHGWVGFEREGRETFVPEGAVCDRAPTRARYAALRGRTVGLR